MPFSRSPMFLLPLDAHGEAQTVVIRGRCLPVNEIQWRLGNVAMQDRWGSGAPTSALSGPEDSSMIKGARRSSGPSLFRFRRYSGPVAKETNPTLVTHCSHKLGRNPAAQQSAAVPQTSARLQPEDEQHGRGRCVL